MTGNLTIYTALALLVALTASAGALTQNPKPMHLTATEFHGNCAAANGHFAMLGGEVVCTLAPTEQIVCQYAQTLGNCLWTGPVEVDTLARIFRSPDAPPDGA